MEDGKYDIIKRQQLASRNSAQWYVVEQNTSRSAGYMDALC